ncbi:Glucose-repressible alcohol dehydrogenase transcriptional effector like, partial [Actinidia chinensis var. chinensis]
MASMQCHRTNHNQPMSSAHCHKPTNEAGHGGNNHEHRFSNKVKEIASSVTKVFTEHRNHGHNSNEDKKKEGHCLLRRGDHKKNTKKKKNKEGKSSDSSSSESEDEVSKRK